MTLDILVAGPPCSGKSTWAREHAGDAAVLDFDEVYAEVTGLALYERAPAWDQRVRALFGARIEQARRSADPVVVVATAPRRWQRRRFGARRTVVLEVSAETCKVRSLGIRPDRWGAGIDQWWATYEPAPGDEVIREVAPCRSAP
jgi:predicted kinase